MKKKRALYTRQYWIIRVEAKQHLSIFVVCKKKKKARAEDIFETFC